MNRLMEWSMLLPRYFLFVGGALLALLLISDVFMPRLPVADRASTNLPVIRVVSDRKPPERVVYDTSRPTISPPHPTDSNVPSAGNFGDFSAKGGERAALAQLQPSEVKQLQAPDPGKRQPRQHRKYRVARRHVPPTAALMVARQWRFGWFGNSIW